MTTFEKMRLVLHLLLTLLARFKLLLFVLGTILAFLTIAMLSHNLFGAVNPRVYAILVAYVVVMLIVMMYSIVMHLWSARSAARRKELTLFEYLREENAAKQ